MNSRHTRPLVVAVIAVGFVAFSAPIGAQQGSNLLEAVARGDLGTLQRALETGYEFLGSVFHMNLDIDRIRTVRPDVHAILRSPG